MTLSPTAHLVADQAAALSSASERLLLLVGPPGTGKSRVLKELKATFEMPFVNLNVQLTQRLLELPSRKRPMAVGRLLGGIFEPHGSGPVLVDNIEVLFLPELQQDPLLAFRAQARNRSLVVAWPGLLTPDGSLTYAEIGHGEHQHYRHPGVPCIPMPSTL